MKIWVETEAVRAVRGGIGAVKAGANYVASLKTADDVRQRGYEQVLWLDALEHAFLEEVGTMNLFVVIGDELLTPPLGGSILSGITRDSILTLLRDWNLRVSERPIPFEEILAASEGRHAARSVRHRHRRGHQRGRRAGPCRRQDRHQQRRSGPDRAAALPGHHGHPAWTRAGQIRLADLRLVEPA